MDKLTYEQFLNSDDTLRVYADQELVFSSKKEGVLPLLEYIDRLADEHHGVIMLDKVVGNAAALLAVRAGCGEIHSPLGSQLAIITLNKYAIRHCFSNIVPYIRQENGRDMCPLEMLSINREPEEFYTMVKDMGRDPAKE